MAAQKQEKNTAVKGKIYTTTEENLKKTIKSKSKYTNRASPNGPLNIYVAGLPRKHMID